MKTLIRGTVLILLTLNPIGIAVLHSQEKGAFVGIWQGALDVGQSKLRLVIHVMQSDSGSLKGSLDSPDQGATGIPATKVSVSGDSVFFEISPILARFSGILRADRSSIQGMWQQGGFALALELKRTESAPLINRPQTPKKPYPYLEEEVSYENAKAGIKLAGTLTKPSGGGRFPAVILITGSGPQDRNETIAGHSPFLVLSDYLSRRGILVLRVDDRGVGGSTGNTMLSTTEDFAADVLAGIGFLKKRRDVQVDRIGLIGHSEGGMIAPLVASRSKDIAFIVLMAGTGIVGEEVLNQQSAKILRSNGMSDEQIQKRNVQMTKLYTIVKGEKDSSVIVRKLSDYLSSTWNEWGTEFEKQGIEKSTVIEKQVLPMVTPWFRFFLVYDPRPALRNVKCPVLALNGEKDFQVLPKENLQEIEKALAEGGNTKVTSKELPGLNHLFQTARSGSPNEYGSIEETISPEALKLIGDWVEQQAKR